MIKPTSAIIDTFTNRVVRYNGTNSLNLTLCLSIEATLPICITKEDKINQLVIANKSETNATKASNATALLDEEYNKLNNQDRFIYITAMTSPITKNVLFMYYDNKYNDIILVPELTFLELSSKNMLFNDVKCYRIGSGMELASPNPNNFITVDECKKFTLPKAKSNITVETKLYSLPGYGLYSSTNLGGIEETMGTFNIKHDTRKVGVLVKLGSVSNILTQNVNLPTYLLYQHNILSYGLKYLGIVNTGNNNLYLTIRF